MSDSENYRLIRQLGTGLAGPVYLAESDTGQVVVRQFRSQSSPGSPAWTSERRHFLAAARQAATLVQSRIVQTREVIDEGDEAFVAMEYVPAETLDPVLKRGDLLPERANYLLRRMALTLDYVHQKGLAHGDLKPSNVFALPERSVKISDFAISPRARTDHGPLPPEWAHPYVSPEHFTAPESIGPRADRYSLAAIAYHLYTGRSPFDEWGADLRAAILTGDMPLASSLREHLSPRVDGVFQKALSRDPQQRYESSMEFVDALEASLTSAAGVAVPVNRRAFNPLYLLAGLLAAGILGAALLISSGKGRAVKPTSAPPQTQAEAPPIVKPDVKDPVQLNGTDPKVAKKPPAPPAKDGGTTAPSPLPGPVPVKPNGGKTEPQIAVSVPPKPLISNHVLPIGGQPVRGGDPGQIPIDPLPTTQVKSLDLAIYSRSRKLENSVAFPYNDPTLGELGHGDLKAVVQVTGPVPKGKFTLEWLVEGMRMDARTITPNHVIEYGNEPTAGTYVVKLRLDAKELKTFVFRITK